MDFVGKLQKSLSQGLASSRELYGKAKERAKDLGEKGLLRYELMQLQKEAESLLGELGGRVYDALARKGQSGVSLATPGIKETVAEIERIHDQIEKKEADLKTVGAQDARRD